MDKNALQRLIFYCLGSIFTLLACHHGSQFIWYGLVVYVIVMFAFRLFTAAPDQADLGANSEVGSDNLPSG